ncbi:hypothetical protein [Camelimonas sp. ID_303_24]
MIAMSASPAQAIVKGSFNMEFSHGASGDGRVATDSASDGMYLKIK